VALLRRVIGDALRARRQGQHRTLREVSTAANVSLGYLSEIERGQKEASSELLAAICEALGSQLSEVLREASDSLAAAERGDAALADASLADRSLARAGVPGARRTADLPLTPAGAGAGLPHARTANLPISDGEVSVSVRRNGPLRTTLHAVRKRPSVAHSR
jgi:transcriptional regulator with XRE-family HTH domain